VPCFTYTLSVQVDKGVIQVGGMSSANISTISSKGNSVFNFRVLPNAGLFLKENFEIGTSLILGFSSNQNI
jgi:hypothetical protein